MDINEADVIELVAKDPDGDLACDFTIANEMARSGLRADLERAMISGPREVSGGIEVRFRPEAWPAVDRYLQLESQCCSFLTLTAERASDAITLRITGREEAQELIRSIFSG
jgi:hypothetical protein